MTAKISLTKAYSNDNITLTVEAVVPLLSVQFYMNDAPVGTAIKTPPYRYALDVNTVVGGQYQLHAEGRLEGGAAVSSARLTTMITGNALQEDDFNDDDSLALKSPVDAFKALLSSHRYNIPVTKESIQAHWQREVKSAGLRFSGDVSSSPYRRTINRVITLPAIWLMNFLVTAVMPNLFTKYAKGLFLDIRGSGVKLPRKGASATEGLLTFKRVNTVGSLTIPAHTVVQTIPINNQIYTLTIPKAAIFTDGVETISVHAVAEQSGSAYNLAEGYYSLLQKPIDGLSVRNNSNWIIKEGADEESDDDYRLRIRNQFGTLASHHIDSVYKGIIASQQGISIDRIYIEHAVSRGPGKEVTPGAANGYVLFDVGDSSQEVVSALNRYIHDEREHGIGDDFQVKAMPETFHTVTATIYTDESLQLTEEQKSELKNKYSDFIFCAFRKNNAYQCTRVWPGRRFSFSRLSSEMHAQFKNIYSVEFLEDDIINQLSVARLKTLNITVL